MPWDVKAVKALPDYCIYMETAGGQAGIFDMKPYLDRGVFREWKDVGYFNRVGIVSGAVTWPHEQDFAPQTPLAGLTPATKPVAWTSILTGPERWHSHGIYIACRVRSGVPLPGVEG